jgi:hypothetical protein
MAKALLEEEKLERAIRSVRKRSFTVLEFSAALRAVYPEDWSRLTERFGEFGEKRRYTISTYLSNRLEVYSRKPHSLLRPHEHYGEADFAGYRRPAAEERERFGSPWIAVYKKRA